MELKSEEITVSDSSGLLEYTNKFKSKTAPVSPRKGGVDWSNSYQPVVLEIPNKLLHYPKQFNLFDSAGVEFEMPDDSDFQRDVCRHLENEINKAITETLESVCFNCESRKMHDDDKEEYYCPVCDR